MTRLLLIPLLFVSLTAKALDPVATPVNNLVGVSGLQPWDNDVMNNLLRSVPATYALCALDYNWWVNGTGNPGFLGGDGPAFYDTMMSINSPYKIILAFYNVPTQKIASFVPMILARYVIWAVQPVNEVADAAQTSDTIKAFRSAAPTARLLGPCLQDDYAPAYLDALVASNALAEIDVLAMHDYAACPGNGGASPQPWGSYVHPSAAPDIYHPNLLGRIQWLQSYTNKLRNVFTDGPKVMLTEYGLYVNDLNDARLAANISRITGVPLVLSSPGAPANQTNSHPYGNGIYSASGKAAVWSAAMQTYVQTMQSPTLLAWAWYAAPDAAASGDGSFQSPWPLPVALAQNTVIQPGDTLYLRGGYYRSPGFFSDLTGTSDNYITVRSAPNEWAVITDGAAGALLTNLSGTNAPTSGVANVSIGGSQFWSVGTVVQIGMEQLLLYGQTGTNWTLTRGWNGTAVAPHTQGEIVRPRSDFITHTGSYVKFQDFEITAGGSTNRIVGTNNYLGSGLNLPAPGQGNKAINLIIHNVGHPGIGFWSQGNGGEINGCIMWGNGMYDNDGAWTRGTAVCAQNETGTVNLKNNIALRNFTEGMQAYGTAAATKGFRFINNISMMNANGVGISIWNTEQPISDNAMWTNYFGLDGMIWGYPAVSNTTLSCLGNVLAKPMGMTSVNYHRSGEIKWNTWLFDGYGGNSGMFDLEYPVYALSNMSFTIDYNRYYYTNHATDLFGLTTLDHPAGGGNLTFAQWQSATGFDANSTLQATFPPNYLNVEAMQLDYDSTKHYVVVISTSGTNVAYLSLAGLGYKTGDRYELRDAQNYFTVVQSGTNTGATIPLPLNLTNVATINGSLTHYTNKHTNVDQPGLFNAFVLRRIPRLSPPGFLRVQPYH